MKSNAVVMSIHPEFVKEIVHGRKTIELRKRFPESGVSLVFIYATAPVCRVIAVARIGNVFQDSPESIWKRFEKYCSIDKERFDKYFLGKDQAFAIEILKTRCFSIPLTLAAIGYSGPAPQSFGYLPDDSKFVSSVAEMMQ